MRTRLFPFCLFLLALSAFTRAAEPYFEIIDSEENSLFGTITVLDRTQVVVDVQGMACTIPFEKLVKIRNIIPNPYTRGASSTHQYQNLLQQMPSALKSTIQGADKRQIVAAHVQKLQANEQAAQKTFPTNVIALELNDGSRLIASSFNVTNNQGIFRLLDQQTDSSLPLNTISAVRFAVRNLSEVLHPPTDWQRLAIPNTEGDRLIIGTPDSFDVYAGILHSLNTETISFAVDDEILPVPRRKVFGLVLHHESSLPNEPNEPPLGMVTLWTGTKGMIADIRLDTNELTWQTSSGFTTIVPLELVEEMDFGGKGAASLIDFELVRSEFSFPFPSDIEPAQLKFLQTFYESRTKNSSPVTLFGGVYERSLTLRGKTSLEYLLPKPFTALKAVIGIEDQFRPHVSATFQILANSQILGTWELRGDAAPERIQLNLPQNCRTITFIVEPLPQSDLPAILTIADPKLLE